jgi:hypothetical protein
MAISSDNHCVIEKLQTPLISLSYNGKLKIIDNKLHSKPSFLDEVIDLFAKKNRRIELNYKQ